MVPPQVGPVDERLRGEHRLQRRSDFARCYREGERRHGALAILYVIPSGESVPRLGVTASRKVGKAVVRHRLRRRTREIYRRWPGRWQLPPLDLVVHLRPAAAGAEFEILRRDLLQLLCSLRPREALRS